MTNYGGQSIDYDAIGNPISYRGATLTWGNGRELRGYVGGGNTITYTYDDTGLRTSKTVNGAKSTYLYVGGQLQGEVRDGHHIHYSYDSYGNLSVIKYYTNDTDYHLFYVMTNAQGDVVSLHNANGTMKVSYEYDAWGNLVNTTDTTDIGIGTINPFRYRGYYYDTETGLYYLTSRYYDPEVRRWVNADSQLNTSQGVLGCSMFAYCLSNPVNKADYDGNKPGDLFNTMDEAAKDFAEYINATSISDGREYASYIYTETVTETRETIYVNPNIFGDNILSWLWNIIFRGGLTKSVYTTVEVTKYTYKEPNRGTATSSNTPINWFGLDNRVALIHSHGAYMPGFDNDTFSPTDKRLAHNKGIPTYVVTPLGTLRKYDPSTQEDILLYDNLPFDPNHPQRRR